ncbi:putative dehydrogenase [Deinococcus peraridilitoris DSM 19664]|uniref:Putative dehydrogenase n=2 Tax=Deinococcus TaxID=1298 RepID=L0A1X8_DEIPD|nr:putative dehydrogenase [Deinococcus peraridilitoris DSM 19664]
MMNEHEVPSDAAPLRLIQIGLGGWGRDWMNIVHKERAVRPVAWVDADITALSLAQQQGAPKEGCFTSLAEALEAQPADAVLITAGVAGHAPIALSALQMNLPVLVEKPFTENLSQASEVIAAARERQLALMVSQNYRFHPAPQLAAQIVREGTLGDIGFVEVDFRRDSARARPAPTAHHALPHPLLLDMAIHHFDLMRFVLGREPLRIDCQTFNPKWSPFRDPASGVATIEFEGGVVVSYRGSWASSGPVTPWAGEWRMDAEGGELRWTSRDTPTPDHVTLRPLDGRPRPLPLPDTGKLDRAGALAAFVQAVRDGTEPPSSGRENLGSLALALAAIRSSQERRIVELSEGAG